jgi:hypothetical protein
LSSDSWTAQALKGRNYIRGEDMKNTYAEIANSYQLWGEYVDTMGLDSEEKFDAMTEKEKIKIITECFGNESPVVVTTEGE